MKFFNKTISILILICFFATVVVPSQAYAQGVIGLPHPGAMVNLSPAFTPAILRGMRVYPENSLKFDFIVDSGNTKLQGDQLKKESEKIVKYFLAALTIPENDLWVNLSPYEENRIIPNALGQTEMGVDLLAQDYILKQIMSSLIYPENDFGKEFWGKVYKKAYEEYGTTNIPIDTFNKVWIVPQKAVIYEDRDKVFLTDSYLKVMMEQDYLALENKKDTKKDNSDQEKERQANTRADNNLSASIAKEVIIPLLEKEVNEGKNFAQLRQIFHAMVLATWYKQALRNSIITKVYADKNKVAGIQMPDERPVNVDNIYNQYLAAHEKGVVNYLKTEYDPYLRKYVTRKYFSGGFEGSKVSSSIIKRPLRALKNTAQSVIVGLGFRASVVLAVPKTTSATSELDPESHRLPDTFNKSPASASNTAVPSLSENTISQTGNLGIYNYIYNNVPEELREAPVKEDGAALASDLVAKYPIHTYRIDNEDVKVHVIPVQGLLEHEGRSVFDQGEKGYILYVDSNLVNDTAYIESQRNIVKRYLETAKESKGILKYLSGSLALLILGSAGYVINRDEATARFYKNFLEYLSKMKNVRVELDNQTMIFHGPEGSRLKIILDLRNDKLTLKHNYLLNKTVDYSDNNEAGSEIFDPLTRILLQDKNFELSLDSIEYVIDHINIYKPNAGNTFVEAMLGSAMIRNPEIFNRTQNYLGIQKDSASDVEEFLSRCLTSAINANLDFLPIVIKKISQAKGIGGRALISSLWDSLSRKKEIKLKKEDLTNILKSDVIFERTDVWKRYEMSWFLGFILSNNPDLAEDMLSMIPNMTKTNYDNPYFNDLSFHRTRAIQNNLIEAIGSSLKDDNIEITMSQILDLCKVTSTYDRLDTNGYTSKTNFISGLGKFLGKDSASLEFFLKEVENREIEDSILSELASALGNASVSEELLNHLENASSNKMKKFLIKSLRSLPYGINAEFSGQVYRILLTKTFSDSDTSFLLHSISLSEDDSSGSNTVVTQSQFEHLFNAMKNLVDPNKFVNDVYSDVESLARVVNFSFGSNPNLKFTEEEFISYLKYAPLVQNKRSKARKALILSIGKILSTYPNYFDSLILSSPDFVNEILSRNPNLFPIVIKKTLQIKSQEAKSALFSSIKTSFKNNQRFLPDFILASLNAENDDQDQIFDVIKNSNLDLGIAIKENQDMFRKIIDKLEIYKNLEVYRKNYSGLSVFLKFLLNEPVSEMRSNFNKVIDTMKPLLQKNDPFLSIVLFECLAHKGWIENINDIYSLAFVINQFLKESALKNSESAIHILSWIGRNGVKGILDENAADKREHLKKYIHLSSLVYSATNIDSSIEKVSAAATLRKMTEHSEEDFQYILQIISEVFLNSLVSLSTSLVEEHMGSKKVPNGMSSLESKIGSYFLKNEENINNFLIDIFGEKKISETLERFKEINELKEFNGHKVPKYLNTISSAYRAYAEQDHIEANYLSYALTSALFHYLRKGGEAKDALKGGLGPKALHEFDNVLLKGQREPDRNVALAFYDAKRGRNPLEEYARKRSILAGDFLQSDLRKKKDDFGLQTANSYILKILRWQKYERIAKDNIFYILKALQRGEINKKDFNNLQALLDQQINILKDFKKTGLKSDYLKLLLGQMQTDGSKRFFDLISADYKENQDNKEIIQQALLNESENIEVIRKYHRKATTVSGKSISTRRIIPDVQIGQKYEGEELDPESLESVADFIEHPWIVEGKTLLDYFEDVQELRKDTTEEGDYSDIDLSALKISLSVQAKVQRSQKNSLVSIADLSNRLKLFFKENQRREEASDFIFSKLNDLDLKTDIVNQGSTSRDMDLPGKYDIDIFVSADKSDIETGEKILNAFRSHSRCVGIRYKRNHTPSTNLISFLLKSNDSSRYETKIEISIGKKDVLYADIVNNQISQIKQKFGDSIEREIVSDIKILKFLMQEIVQSYKGDNAGIKGVGVEQIIMQSGKTQKNGRIIVEPGSLGKAFEKIYMASYDQPSGRIKSLNEVKKNLIFYNENDENCLDNMNQASFNRLVHMAKIYIESQNIGDDITAEDLRYNLSDALSYRDDMFGLEIDSRKYVINAINKMKFDYERVGKNKIFIFLKNQKQRDNLDQFLSGQRGSYTIRNEIADKKRIPSILKQDQEVVLAQGHMASSQASATASSNVGGIDFNAEYLDIEKRGSSSIEFNVPVEWQGMNLQDLPGLIPASISITPMTNIYQLLGLDENEPNTNEDIALSQELVANKENS